METTNVTELRKNIKAKLDRISNEKETIIIHRSGQEDVVMIPISEYNSWKATLHLYSTKANRENLEAALEEVKQNKLTPVKTKDLWK